MAVFRRLVYAALCAGLVSGFFAAAAHQIGTVPLIIEAETYERAAPHPATEADAHAAENSIERAAKDAFAGQALTTLLRSGFRSATTTVKQTFGTSFGQDAMNSGNDRNDEFLLELLLRYAPPSVVQNGTSKSDIVSSLQKKELRVKPLSHYAS